MDRKRWECSALPQGWKKEEVTRRSGLSAGKSDVYYYSPSGKKFRSKPQLARYLGNSMDLSTFDFRTGKMLMSKINKNRQRLRYDGLNQAKMSSQEFVRELIALYRSLPCLWKMRSADYTNKYKKKEAYQQLIALFKKHKPDEAVEEKDVRSKIRGLQTVYKRELNKVEKSIKSGAGADDVYTPTLWYYDLMAFTRDQKLPRKMLTLMDELPQDPEVRTSSPVGDEHIDEVHADSCTAPTPLVNNIDIGNISSEETRDEEAGPSRVTLRQNLTRKCRADRPPSPDFLVVAKKILNAQSGTKVGHFAKLVDERLGNLEETQRGHAEIIILDVLSKGAAGKLTDTTVYTDAIQPQPYSQLPEFDCLV